MMNEMGAEMRLAHCEKAAKKALMGHSSDLLKRMSAWMELTPGPAVNAAMLQLKQRIASMTSDPDDMQM